MTTLEFGVELLSSGGIVRVQQQLEFADFEVLRNAVQDAPTPMDIVQLGQGEMAGTLAHLSVGSVGISTGSFTRGVRQRGVLSTNRWTFGMLLGSSALLQHFEATPGDLIVIAPDQELYSRFINGNHYATTLVAPDELFAFLATQPGAQITGQHRGRLVPRRDIHQLQNVALEKIGGVNRQLRPMFSERSDRARARHRPL
ncbi:hypothetical protein HAP48_0028200 [Bradyrhizobium septentrionale]|uniref:Uncharacterized protein n=1 Tax=Bradyrhizobium septentrionale TaxID=1404411 RepID=A0A973VXE0_9BRAD|nr:hypothetical protein [Bradyrhizobium septentrionale]UGY12503.1 hypothetical protein HAP48_0028200 [Bradyrhizobium septentrionale]